MTEPDLYIPVTSGQRILLAYHVMEGTDMTLLQAIQKVEAILAGDVEDNGLWRQAHELAPKLYAPNRKD